MKTRNGRRIDDDGFSLVEALIAIAIFAMGILSVITMLDVGFNTTRLSRNMTTATELASSMMDRIRNDSTSQNDPFTANINSLMTYNGMNTNNAAPASAPASISFLQWQAQIQQNLPNGANGIVTVTQNPDPNLQLNYFVTVQINWPSFMQKNVRLVSEIVVAE